MKKTRILCFLLALLMTFPFVLPGCAKIGDEPTCVFERPTEPEPEPEPQARDLNGHVFTFLVRTSERAHLDTNEVYAAELNGDRVNDAVFKRNSILQEKYNCEIREERVENAWRAEKDALLAGEYRYDYIYASLGQLSNFSSSGLLADLNTLESIDLDRSRWDQNAREGLPMVGKLFYLSGDAGTMDDRATWIMLFNRDLAEKNHLESPFALVTKGEWTVAKMLEYMEICAEDVNGNGVMEPETDVYGYAGDPYSNWIHVAACNTALSVPLPGIGFEISPVIDAKVLEVWAELKPLLTSPARAVSDSEALFRNGQGLFHATNAGEALSFGEDLYQYGVIPMPKRNASQEKYWSSVHGSLFCCYAIPYTADRAEDAADNGFADGREQAAYFLDAFAYHSKDTLTVAFYSQFIHPWSAPEEGVAIVELCFQNKLLDPLCLFRWAGLIDIFSECSPLQSGMVSPDPRHYDDLAELYKKRCASPGKTVWQENIEIES